jgi:thiol-disulfide isomerase/thioredoxin
MAERLIFAALISVLGIAAWIAFNRLSMRRVAAEAPDDPLLTGLQPGIPAVVYFTTPFCEPCRTLQKPALTQLQAELGTGVQVLTVDAAERPDVADRWGVFSAPTTFILDGRHTPRHVNRGVAPFEMLKRQLQQLDSKAAA